MKRYTVAVVLAVSLLGSAAYAAPNLVTNGNFNSTTYTQNTEFGAAFGGQGVNNWVGNNGYNLFFTNATDATTVNALGQYQSTGNEKLWGVGGFRIGPLRIPGTLPASPGGGSFVALDGDQSGGVQGMISQSISGLTAGTVYALSFDWGAGQVQSRDGSTTEQFRVSLGSATQSTAVVSNASDSFNGWQHVVMNFSATAATETLSFLSVGTPASLPPIATLDDVSLVAVPEPVSLAMLGIGLVGIGYVRRGRKA